MYTKDGFFKALEQKIGDDAYILLAGGGIKKLVDLLESASLGVDGNATTLSIKVAGTTKTSSVNVPYATIAGSANSVTWANVTSKPGSTGNSTQPVYWNGSTFVACTAYANASVNYANNADTVDGYHYNNLPYLPISGGTMTGCITTKTGSSHNGIKLGDTYLTSIGGEVIFQNNTSIRFGGDSWDWNVWAELGYVHSNKIVYLGLAGSPYSANSTQTGGKIYTPGIDNIYIGNGTYTVLHSGNSSVSKFGETLTVKINGTSQSLTNTWRGITNTYTGSDQGTSVSQYGTNALYNALVNGYANSAGNADTVDSLHGSNLVRFFLSPMTSGAPADSAKSWFTGTMPSASGAIIYNVPGSEKTIIAGKSSGSYGHMLQLNYDDTYLRILRYAGGSWKSTDWEKISAGYADSAGSASSAGNADTVDGEHASAFAHRQQHNNLIADGNEFTFVGSGYSGPVYFNYRTTGGTNGNITEYIFARGNTGTLATLNGTGTILTSNNWSSYISVSGGNYLPLTGGTMTGETIFSSGSDASAFRPDKNNYHYIGTESYRWWKAFINSVYGTFHHKDKDSNDYVLLAGGGYKALSEFGGSGGGSVSWSNVTSGTNSNELYLNFPSFVFRDANTNWVLGKNDNNTGTISMGSSAIAQDVELNSSGGNLTLKGGGNVGIGTRSPSYKLHVNGNVGASSFYTTSDATKKKNITQFSDHIYRFTYKESNKDAYGVIAQNVEEMFRHGEEGNMTVNYDSVLSYYVGLLENRIKNLEEEIRILKNK